MCAMWLTVYLIDAVAELSVRSIHIHKDLHSAYSLSERKPYSFFKNAGRVLFIIIRLLLFSFSLGFSRKKFQPNEDTATPPSVTPNAHSSLSSRSTLVHPSFVRIVLRPATAVRSCLSLGAVEGFHGDPAGVWAWGWSDGWRLPLSATWHEHKKSSFERQRSGRGEVGGRAIGGQE